MKSKCISAALVFSFFSLFSQTTPISDSFFEQALIDQEIDTNGLTGDILNTDAVVVTFLAVADSNISDFTGLGAFTSLQFFYCSGNIATSLDLSLNPALTTVDCSGNLLTSLNVTNNPALFNLDCRDNQLASVNLLSNPDLNQLNVGYNPLTSFDVSQNPALDNLVCDGNNLASLDVSNNTNLTFLNISIMASLTSIDLSSNSLLENFISLSSGLTTLDVTLNTALTNIDVRGNQLLDLDLSLNTNLFNILCNNNLLQNLNVKNGNNSTVTNGNFNALNNSLTCITVDDVSYSTSTWSNIDGGVTFSTNCALGIEEFDETSIIMYPNPAENEIKLNIIENAKYYVSGIQSQVVLKGYVSSGENILDISSLNTGLYFLNIESNNSKLMTKKIIKK